MANTTWDACVIGAGPAGALAAERLATSGRRVLMVDKARFPRPKVCGGCLGGVGLAALHEADASLETLGVPLTRLTRLRITSGRRRAEMAINDRRAIGRDAFDLALAERAIAAGVHFVTDRRAVVGAVGDGVRGVALTAPGGKAESIDARLVLLASGLGGPGAPTSAEPGLRPVRRVPSRVGAGAIVSDASTAYPPGEVTMACCPRGSGYVGVVRLATGDLDVAAALVPRSLKRSADASPIADTAAEILRRNDLPVPSAWSDAVWSAVPGLTQAPRRLGAERLLLIGDAAGYVEPFTGEGMGWALRSALDVQPFAQEAIARWRPGLLDAWRSQHARSIGRWRRRCRFVCDLIGARRATPAVVAALSAFPWLAGPVLRSIEDASISKRTPSLAP